MRASSLTIKCLGGLLFNPTRGIAFYKKFSTNKFALIGYLVYNRAIKVEHLLKYRNNQMMSKIRIPTEQYAYIEVDFEGNENEIVEKYRELTSLYKNNVVGLLHKEWNIALDRFLSVGNLEEGQYNSMSLDQQKVIQELKKAFKRAEAKNRGAFKDFEDGVDNAVEHQFHTEADPKCSECYKIIK